MSKIKPKKAAKTKAAGRIKKAASRPRIPGRLAGGRMIEFKAKQSKSVQKTVRVPREIFEWLDSEVKRVPTLTIPTAIVQILEDAFKKSKEQTKSA